MKKIGLATKYFREKNKFSQKDLAYILDVKVEEVIKAEDGHPDTRFDYTVNACAVFKISMNEFFSRVVKMKL
jgi:DNA-binding XRE family transcriptional regulator